MRASIIALAVVLGACGRLPHLLDPVTHLLDPVATAAEYVGLTETNNRAEITQLVGVDPVSTEWCAAFVNAILDLDGVPGSDTVHEYPLLARSFLHWGEPIAAADIRRGDVVVFPRGNAGWQGHVGFYKQSAVINGVEQWLILGGNQDQSVSYAWYPAASALGVRRWMQPDQDVVVAGLWNFPSRQ